MTHQPEISINQLLTLQHEQANAVQLQNITTLEAIREQLGSVSNALLTNGALSSLTEFSGQEGVSEWLTDR